MQSQVSELDPARLIDLLSRQRDLYRSLRELSERQRHLIVGDRPELLVNILRDRQDLVTALARLNNELGPFRRNWDAVYTALPAERRSVASDLLREINGLLRVILQTDQQDGELLAVRKLAAAKELGGLTGGRAANAAYAQPPAPSHAPADLTG